MKTCKVGFFIFLLLCLADRSRALNAETPLLQYGHKAWRLDDGSLRDAPEGITQTTDGYIWLATPSGLVRFDGITYVKWSPPSSLPTNEIVAVFGGRDGALWIGTDRGLARWKDNVLTKYPMPPSSVEEIHELPNGEIWFTRAHLEDDEGALCQVMAERVICYGQKDGQPLPFAQSLRHDAMGNFWVGGTTTLVSWRHGTTASYPVKSLLGSEQVAGIWAIEPGPDNSMWVGITQAGKGLGLQQLRNGEFSPLLLPNFDSSTLEVCALTKDSEGSLWIGTLGQGIYRIAGQRVDRYGPADGLSGYSNCNFYEDHEGAMWVTSANGLDMFRDLPVVSYGKANGLSADSVTFVLATRTDALWVGNLNSIDVIRQGAISSIDSTHGLPGRQPNGVLGAHDGRLWIGTDDDVGAFASGQYKPVREANGNHLGTIDSAAEDSEGDIWITTISSPQHLWRIHNFVATEELKEPQMEHVRSITAGTNGDLLLGFNNGKLGQLKDHKLVVSALPTSEGDHTINALGVEPDGNVIAATSAGLVIHTPGKDLVLGIKNGLPCEDFRSFLRDRANDLWLYGTCGYVRIAKSELDRWLAAPKSPIQFTYLDVLDGARPPFAALNTPPATMSANGHLWFATGTSLQEIDPLALRQNGVPPPIHVERVIADRVAIDIQTPINLPALTRDLEVDYTATSFTLPQRVRFQYRLRGRSDDWIDAGTRRQAFYSDLKPGTYRFEVRACNNDGLWNNSAQGVDFAVLPAIYQTNWFRSLCVVFSMLVLWLAYIIRARQLQQYARTMAETEARERERIARGLHDTLLQGVQGLIYKIGAVAERLPPERDRRDIETALDRAEEVLAEGRHQVINLRRRNAPHQSLSDVFSEEAKNIAAQSNCAFVIRVQGSAAELNDAVFEEFLRIGVEALTNAFRHSEATTVELTIDYREDLLTLSVRDNGRGFDATDLQRPVAAGHFGLVGMRERATRIGAMLEIESDPVSGSHISLRITAAQAYRQPHSSTLREHIIRILSGKTAKQAPAQSRSSVNQQD